MGNAKVGQISIAVLVQQNIARLQVAVNNALLVGAV
jgi:hypothetical protein